MKCKHDWVSLGALTPEMSVFPLPVVMEGKGEAQAVNCQ